MRLSCPTCAAVYEVPDGTIGPNGRRIRCRACDTSWIEPGHAAPVRPAAKPDAGPPPSAPSIDPPPPPARVGGRRPWLLLLLGTVVLALGVFAAVLAFGSQDVAQRLGLPGRRVPLGIAITRQPDWRLIAGGSQLFAVSGRVWNPTRQPQAVPDIRAELRDKAGHPVYAWTIARPVARLAPGAAASFDGAAVDVPRSSANISVTFADDPR